MKHPEIMIEEYEEYKASYHGLAPPLTFDKWEKKQIAKNILQENSLEIKHQRHSEMVDYNEIEKILKSFENMSSEEIFTAIGLHPTYYHKIKREGKCKKTTKYALLGLMAERDKTQNYKFSFSDLAILFSGLLSIKTTPEIKLLQKVLASLMVKED